MLIRPVTATSASWIRSVGGWRNVGRVIGVAATSPAVGRSSLVSPWPQPVVGHGEMSTRQSKSMYPSAIYAT